MSVKKAVKARFSNPLQPWKGKKAELDVIKGDVKSLKPEVPTADTSAQDEAMERARLQQAELDEEENRRRKRLFAAAAGARGFKGSAMFRKRAGDTASRAASSVAASAGSAQSGGIGGGNAGTARGSYRTR